MKVWISGWIALCCAGTALAQPNFPVVLEGIFTDNAGVDHFSWSFELQQGGVALHDTNQDVGTWFKDPNAPALEIEFLQSREAYFLRIDGKGQAVGCLPGMPHFTGNVVDPANNQVIGTWEGCAY